MTKDRGKGSKQGLTHLQVLELGKRIELYCKSDPQNEGWALYTHGTGDHTVLAELKESIPLLNLAHVQRLRRAMFGRVREARTPAEPSGLTPVLDQMIERIRNLEIWAEQRPVQPFDMLKSYVQRK